MSRPQKAGLEYFPLDVMMDDNIELLEFDHGLEGFAILIKLYQKIYDNGYYLRVNNRILKLFSKRINVDIKLVESVIMSAITYKIFDKTLFERYQILTSTGIQKRYFKATERRSSVEYFKEFFLLNPNNYKNLVERELMYTKTPSERGLMYTKTLIEQELMYTENTQSKVKYSKEKNSKVKNINNSAQKSKTDLEIEPEPEEAPSAELSAPSEKNVFATASKESKLYTSVKTIFEEEQLQHRFTNYPKEGKAIKQLIKKAKARSPDDPETFLLGMIEQFRELRESGDKFWKGQPFLPSALNSAGIFDRVLNEAHQRWKENQPVSGFNIEEVVF